MGYDTETESEQEEKWTPAYEAVWYPAFVTKFDQHYLIAKLEGAHEYDQRYRVYCHHSTVVRDFGTAVVGTKIKVRLRPNRKEGSTTFWEAIEVVIELKDLAASPQEKTEK
jgi:hypothetical protein